MREKILQLTPGDNFQGFAQPYVQGANEEVGEGTHACTCTHMQTKHSRENTYAHTREESSHGAVRALPSTCVLVWSSACRVALI